MILTLPVPLCLGNSRMHWAAKAKAQKAWGQRAMVTEPRLLRERPRDSIESCEVSATFFLNRLRDPDNAASSLKWVLDLLVRLGYLMDDGPDVVKALTVRQERVNKRAEQRLTIEIKPMAFRP
jgi:hypothetical protein